MAWSLLEKLWQRTVSSHVTVNSDTTSWDKEIETLYRLGISMEDALQFLYFEKPDFEAFKTWIHSRKREAEAVASEREDDVLLPEDLEFWDKNGYVIVREAISKQDCKATEEAIWNFLGMDPNDKESWYNRHAEQKGLMLSFSDHETLNKNRGSVRIRKAYEQLYKTSKIYPTIDKVSFNPPETEHFRFRGSPLHWDVSLKQPIPFAMQGLLYLTDCGPQDGAFHCVPGFHNSIDLWLEGLEEGEHPREKAINTLQPIPIAANTGDFIIWQNTLPHCAMPNHGSHPRMVQYLTYLPDDYYASPEWI